MPRMHVCRGISLILITLFATTCTQAVKPLPFLKNQGTSFIDPEGRQVILHGINLVEKNRNLSYLGKETQEDYSTLRNWGFNVIRFGIIWDGLEPEPGKFNEPYLEAIDQRIAWARENNLYVMLDMHQDLYSVKYSDGAPAWATLDEGKPHVSDGVVWSDAYATSAAVQTAFERFWENAPAPDGVGLQDHYAQAWRHIAQRYANEPIIIGFDLMNEPFIGLDMTQVIMQMGGKVAEVLSRSSSTPISALDIVNKWSSFEGRTEILNKLADMTIYQEIVDAMQPPLERFEKNKLQPFYQRVANAIRQVNTRHILFCEPSVSSNVGVRSALEPLTGPDGLRDPRQAYAPHGYDLVTDTAAVTNPSSDRVAFIFQRHAETATRLDMPVLVGEWGAYGGSKEALPAAQTVVRELETIKCGETYWTYQSDLDTVGAWDALHRAYPERIAGTLKTYNDDPATQTFTCAWSETGGISAPTILYLPAAFQPSPERIKLDPPSELQIEPSGQTGFRVTIAPLNKTGERTLTITAR